MITMMIKLRTSTESGEWAIFDQCRDVQYDSTAISIPVDSDVSRAIKDISGWDARVTHLFHDLEPVQHPGGEYGIIGRLIRWESPDGSHLIFTDAPDVFLMNDDGATVDRI